MEEQNLCPECGATIAKGTSCRDYLNEMIKWDFEDFNGAGKVHHLTVLSYNLQHPSVYSQKGLENGISSLQKFILHPDSFKEHDESNRKELASDVRDWKITGTPENHAEYPIKPNWTVLPSDVVRGGLDLYVENVKKWSKSVLESLKYSGNLDEGSLALAEQV